MKKLFVLSAILTALVGCSSGGGSEAVVSPSVPGPGIGSFQNLDVFYSGSFTDKPMGAARDSAGNLFAAGYSYISGKSFWTIRKSVDSGANWSTVDSFQLNSGENSYAMGIAIDDSDRVFAIGSGENSSKKYWLVRRSTNAGASWATVDQFQLNATYDSFALSMAIDSSGVLFVAGYGDAADGFARTVVRQSSDSGTSWLSVNTYIKAGPTSSYPSAIVIDESDVAYVVGYAGGLGFALKSTDGGATWTTTYDSNDLVPFNAYTVDSSIYVLGNSSSVWTVAVSTDGLVSTSVIDSYELTSGAGANARSMIKDAKGNLYVIGNSGHSNGAQSAIVRGSSDGVAWYTLDSYQYGTAEDAYGLAILTDTADNILTFTEASDGSGFGHWITRSASAAP